MRKGQPERMSKLQKLILTEMYKNKDNPMRYKETHTSKGKIKLYDHQDFKKMIAIMYNKGQLEDGRLWYQKGKQGHFKQKFNVIFHNSIWNLSKKGLIINYVSRIDDKVKSIDLTEKGEKIAIGLCS